MSGQFSEEIKIAKLKTNKQTENKKAPSLTPQESRFKS